MRLSSLANRKVWEVTLFIALPLLVCYTISRFFVSSYGFVEHAPHGLPNPDLEYEISIGLSPDAREFAIARLSLPVVLVSQKETFVEGEYGVVFQVDSTTPQELKDAFHIEVESAKE